MDDQGNNRAGGGIRSHKLRGAWSAFFGLVAVLLVALWVRSYSVGDLLYFAPTGSNKLLNQSAIGNIKIYYSDTQQWSPMFRRGFHNTFVIPEYDVPLAFSWRGFQAPHWVYVSAMVAIAVVPWVTGRFSLRTLLVGMTFVAVALGLIVWIAK